MGCLEHWVYSGTHWAHIESLGSGKNPRRRHRWLRALVADIQDSQWPLDSLPQHSPSGTVRWSVLLGRPTLDGQISNAHKLTVSMWRPFAASLTSGPMNTIAAEVGSVWLRWVWLRWLRCDWGHSVTELGYFHRLNSRHPAAVRDSARQKTPDRNRYEIVLLNRAAVNQLSANCIVPVDFRSKIDMDGYRWI